MKNEEFAKRLIKLRLERGLSKTGVARLIGVSTTCVWNWEQGNTFPRDEALHELARVLRTSAGYLERGGVPPVLEPKAKHNFHQDRQNPKSASVAETIANARMQIAEVAGLEVSQVKITLEYAS